MGKTQEETFKSLFLLAPIGMFITQSGRFVLVNHKFAELTGFSEKELLELHYEDLVYPQDRERCKMEAINTIKGKHFEPYEFRALKKDGEVRWVMATITSIIYQGKRSGLGIVLDITEKKMLGEKLREVMEQLSIIIENVQEGITFSDEQGKFYVYNSEMERLTGYTMEEANTFKDFMQILYPDREEYRKAMERLEVVRNKKILKNIETVFTTKNGNQRHILLSTCLITYKEKVMFLSIYHDVTELKDTERALRLSEEKYRSMFDNAVEGIFQSTPSGRFISSNPSLARMYGFSSPEELITTVNDIWTQLYVNPDDRLHLKEMLEKDGIVLGFETQLYRKDKSILWVSINARIVRDAMGNVLYYEGTVEDITKRKMAEERLNRTLERLRKSIGITVQTIVQIVESRDPYTAGHQIKVSRLARAIAKEMKLPDNSIDAIRMAGLVHDIGKISIPSDILNKPGKLTGIEMELLKLHPQKGYEILKDIESEWNLGKIVLQHHERIDGSGYPKGLKGDEIIIEAKILAVADVVEAMSSHRPYRCALGIDEALKELEINKGVLYDKDVAEACIRLFKEGRFSFDG